jgi:hypothetical protein
MVMERIHRHTTYRQLQANYRLSGPLKSGPFSREQCTATATSLAENLAVLRHICPMWTHFGSDVSLKNAPANLTVSGRLKHSTRFKKYERSEFAAPAGLPSSWAAGPGDELFAPRGNRIQISAKILNAMDERLAL